MQIILLYQHPVDHDTYSLNVFYMRQHLLSSCKLYLITKYRKSHIALGLLGFWMTWSLNTRSAIKVRASNCKRMDHPPWLSSIQGRSKGCFMVSHDTILLISIKNTDLLMNFNWMTPNVLQDNTVESCVWLGTASINGSPSSRINRRWRQEFHRFLQKDEDHE
jgi:hypothetical protein